MLLMELWINAMQNKLLALVVIFILGCTTNSDNLAFEDYIDEKHKDNIANLDEIKDFDFDREAYMESGNVENIELPAIKYKTVPFDTLNIAHVCEKFSGNDVKVFNNSNSEKNEEIVRHIAHRINGVFGCDLAVQYEITESEIYGALVRNNKIVLTSGVFSESHYIDEIVFIIAHEMVHHVLLHNQQINLIRSKKTRETNRAARDIYVYLNTIAWAEVADTFMDDYTQGHLMTNHLMIPNEVTADVVAVDIMVKAGYSPQAMRYVLERAASCLAYHDGDLNTQFAHMQAEAKKFNESKNKSMENYFEIIGDLFSQTHLPQPWREKTVSTYIKANYPTERRLRMTPVSSFKVSTMVSSR